MSYFHDLPDYLFVPPQGPLPGVLFRCARQNDARALHSTCYAHRSQSHFEDEFARSLRVQATGHRVHLLAICEDRVVGSGQLIAYTRTTSTFAHRVEIADLIVDRPYRDQGIGTALIGILERIAAHAGFPRVEIGVMAVNERALALYKRLGFTVKGELALPGGVRAFVLHKATTASIRR
ncbi:MAG: N-acetyltransferase family protein [Chloroflexota bacterium]